MTGTEPASPFHLRLESAPVAHRIDNCLHKPEEKASGIKAFSSGVERISEFFKLAESFKNGSL